MNKIVSEQVIPAAGKIAGYALYVVEDPNEKEARPTRDDIHVESVWVVAWRVRIWSDPGSVDNVEPIVFEYADNCHWLLIEMPDGSVYETGGRYQSLAQAIERCLEELQRNWDTARHAAKILVNAADR